MSEQEHKTFFSPGSTEELHLFEQAQGPHGENGFAIYYEKDDQLNFDASYENMDEQVYNPLPRSLWPLPKFPNEQYRVSTVTDVKAVFDLVRGYIYEFVELPHDTLYDILSLWVVASYIPEKFDSVPYLTFLGPKDSGKTRALEVLWQLSYRSMLSPSFSSAALFRTVDQYGPTVCLDESEIYGSEQKTEAIAVLNAGYRKGQFVLRVKTENGSIDRFSCFSFKALASTKLFVSTLDSRSIGVHMRRNVRDVPLFLDMERAASLRLMLLIYRMNVLKDKTPILEGVEQVLEYLPVKHGRVAELFYPLVSVSPENVRERVSEYAKQVYTSRLEEEKASLEAEMVEVLVSLRDRVEAGKLTIQDITDKLNEGKSEKQQRGPRSVGRQVKALGFNSTRVSGGLRAIFYDMDLLDYLAARYGYTSEKTSLTSLTSLSMEHTIDGKSDISGKSDVSLGVDPSLDDLTTVYWTEEYSEKKCGVCGYIKMSSWEAMTNKNEKIQLCEDCAQTFQKEQRKPEG